MDKQQELAKKIRNAINNTLGKEDISEHFILILQGLF